MHLTVRGCLFFCQIKEIPFCEGYKRNCCWGLSGDPCPWSWYHLLQLWERSSGMSCTCAEIPECSIENEPDWTWNKKMYSLIQEMIHFRNKSQVPYTPETEKSSDLKKEYLKIQEITRKEYEDIPANIYYEKDIIYSWEWRNTCGIICYFCMISRYLLLITKRKGFWKIISGNRRRPWHLGVSKVSIISVNAWLCLFWCGWKNQRIYLTECPRYLDKENRWLWLSSVYTIVFLKSS